MTRRRDFSAEKQRTKGVPRAVFVKLEVAVESALKGGYCPVCGTRVGRAVREHYSKCGGA